MFLDIMDVNYPDICDGIRSHLKTNLVQFAAINTVKDSIGFQDVIAHEMIITLLQPIIDLHTMQTIGYEALSRGPEGTRWHSPIALIEEAMRCDMLWKLELIFRKKAIAHASEVGVENLLFVNVDPNVIHDPKFEEGLTKHVVYENGLKPGQIVFEITERTAIHQYDLFKEAIEHYKKQGYNIAIDDTGAGYSNLNAISHIHPSYIKIDMELIRDIDTNSFKQAIVKSFVVLSNLTGSKLIAEGVETIDEAKTLISIGVHMGQGYLFGRPNREKKAIDKTLKDELMGVVVSGQAMHAYNTRYIGEIAEPIASVSHHASCNDVKEKMRNNQWEGLCVVDADRIVGLVMKNKLYERLSRQYGFSLYAKKAIGVMVLKDFLIVDMSTPIGTVTEMALARNEENLYDNVVVTQNGKYFGMVTINRLLRHAMELERTYALELNPLTGLPGNVQINRVLMETIQNGYDACVLYFDLDNFKVYNDIYGFEQGDVIIKLLKNILCDVIKTGHQYGSFVGHIGGDDFISVIHCDENEVQTICQETIELFDRQVVNLFHDEHRRLGYIDFRDRLDRVTRFPLTSLSIAGLTGNMSIFLSPAALAERMAKIKKKAKAIDGSSWIVEKADVT